MPTHVYSVVGGISDIYLVFIQVPSQGNLFPCNIGQGAAICKHKVDLTRAGGGHKIATSFSSIPHSCIECR